MKKTRIFTFIALAVAFVGMAVVVKSSNTDIWNLAGIGTYQTKDMVHVDSTYNLRLYNGNVVLGDNGLAPSTDNTQTTASTSVGGYYGIKVPIKFTAAVANGDVICSSNAGTGFGYKCDSSNIKTAIGIADGTYAASTVGYITVGGYALVKTTHTVAIGDILVSTAVTGRASTNNTPSAGTNLGVALSAGASGGDTVIVRLR